MRVDPGQRFTCSQCGRCCRGFDVAISDSEIDFYRRRNAAAWFDDGSGAGNSEPFERVPGAAVQRIHKRADGACGFLSRDNRCRIHEELGAAQKPLTCRVFPFAFHPGADGPIATASFNCPSIAGNTGASINEGATRVLIESLRKEWVASHPATSAALAFADGRSMTTRSLFVLRQHLLTMLTADGKDLRAGVRRIAAILDDLTRSRVRALADADFAEYVSLTVPHAAAKQDAPPPRSVGPVARMLQYGFLYAAIAIRDGLTNPNRSRMQTRIRRLRLLAHFHGLAPAVDGVNVKALKRRAVDINDEEVRPIALHYLRSTIETFGATGRPIVDELSVAVSYLNTACALAAMKADAAGTNVNRDVFITALTEASDAAHAHHPLLDSILKHLSSGTSALWVLSTREGVAN